ncbi:hypothetical protein K2173_022077 [Erythroxylum novogranatense]|uniref:Integrator complex subunit 3 n=1 Tax=Erythroxylum novogranatense TaxID=1862640 RepID=A0AAV8TVD9_9ROSI|nr:hypothetical protein K2173_022077 [Erythroxylum novogranatense]
MTSKLLEVGAYDATNEFEQSLIQAFEELQPKLRPPFSLAIPNAQGYAQLNRAILYGVLTEPQLFKTHIKHLHAIVTDGYAFFVGLAVRVVNDLYVKLVHSVKLQLICVVKEVLNVLGVGFDGLLVCLLRQIVGGDFSDGNLWLCFELVNLFLNNWDCLVEEEPFVLTSALYVYLRLLADHCRVFNNEKLELIKKLEIEFCVKMLREQFCLSMQIGRDLIRLLQDLFHVPEFLAIWKDLILKRSEFRNAGFSDITQIYSSKTSTQYFLLRVTPEMETQLRFLLTHVNFGCQRRYQTWFTKKFLSGQDRETVIIDIVRFICCVHHPPDEIIHSNITPRWAILGWLLKTCRKNYIESNVKLALFYDWLFFDDRIDNVMNIEPAMLLMVCSMHKYIGLTQSLLDFLLLLVDNYDMDHKPFVCSGLCSAFNALVRKGIVHSLDVLTSSDTLSPILKERLGILMSRPNFVAHNELQPINSPHRSLLPSNLQDMSCLEIPTPSIDHQHANNKQTRIFSAEDSFLPISNESVSTSINTNEKQIVALESLVQNLANVLRNSNVQGLQILEDILSSYMNLDAEASSSFRVFPDIIASALDDQFESIGYKLFSALDFNANIPLVDNPISSATFIITRSFVIYEHERVRELLLFWSRKGFPVGAYLLLHASRLAYEAYVASYSSNGIVANNSASLHESGMPWLTFHIDGYYSSLKGRKEDSGEDAISSSKLGKEFLGKLVQNAFNAYKSFLAYSKSILHKEDVISLSTLLSVDLVSCSEWAKEREKFLFCSIFYHLADLCIAKGDVIKLLVNKLDDADLVNMQFDVGLKKFSLFGENTEAICNLITVSLSWNALEQKKLWELIRSELVVSNIQVEKIILDIFCSHDLDKNVSAIAIGGLLSLFSCLVPTPELVGAIMLLPNNIFPDFAASVLATWVVSNASILFESLAKFSEKLVNKNGKDISSAGIIINKSATLWLVKFFSEHGINASNILSNFSINNPN